MFSVYYTKAEWLYFLIDILSETNLSLKNITDTPRYSNLDNLGFPK